MNFIFSLFSVIANLIALIDPVFLYLCMMYQRSLSNMRIPSYIGEVTCTDIDPGNLPPYIHGMRAVPTDMNDIWAIEMDIEYSGGAVLCIETRLEVPELDSQNSTVESSSVGEATTDILEEFEQMQEDLKLSDGKNDSSEQKDTEDLKLGELCFLNLFKEKQKLW